MFTDMVGYTALGQRDEAFSLALVEEQRKLIRPVLARHGGREVKTIGDAFLVEFPNAVDAVRCAYDIQRTIREFNLSLAPDKRIRLRIGVHLGEVFESQGDISGDAVNVASRIEPLSEDGGVSITRQVHDHVKNKVDFDLRSLGPKSLKNVAEPIEIYKMVLPWEKAGEGPSSEFDSTRIAILPFANMSPDPNDEYFADGMTEELISTMSRISGLSVIARTSVMGYKQEKKKISDVARELGVGTVLEGSVRKAGNRLRITVQLIDCDTSDHLWAESYDREMQDVFAIQSEVSQTVASALKVKLLPGEKHRVESKPTDVVEAYESYLKGLETATWTKGSYEKEDIERSREHFEQAVKLDPNFALAYAGLEQCYMEAFAYNSYKERFPKAEAAALKALEIDDGLAEAHVAYGDLLWHSYNLRGAEREWERAVQLKPNSPQAHLFLGIHYMIMHRFDDAGSEIRRARELDPLSPAVREWNRSLLMRSHHFDSAIAEYTDLLAQHNTADLHNSLATAHFFKGDYGKALAEAEAAMALADPDERPDMNTTLACIYSKIGREEEARKIVKELEESKGKEGTYWGDSDLRHVPRMNFAMIYSALGETDWAIRAFEEAYEEHEDDLPLSISSPRFDMLRSNPRFKELLGKLGFG
jgi:adenylate cyclase